MCVLDLLQLSASIATDTGTIELNSIWMTPEHNWQPIVTLFQVIRKEKVNNVARSRVVPFCRHHVGERVIALRRTGLALERTKRTPMRPACWLELMVAVRSAVIDDLWYPSS
jgi:hypothetical protein